MSNGGNAIGTIQSSLPALLKERASRQPDATAYTFIDYEVDPAGVAKSITWSEAHRRALGVAEELSLCGSIGDRAAIMARRGFVYFVPFSEPFKPGSSRSLYQP